MERERQRQDDAAPAPGQDPGGDPRNGTDLDAAAARARAVADAGRNAIRQALSGDSAAYLGATRQRGGE